MTTGGFGRAQQSSSQFSAMAITSISLGVSALSLAVFPWISLVIFPLFSFLSTLGLALCIPAAIVGAVTGLVAMRGYGAAAHRSLPMAKGGLLTSVLAIIFSIAWLLYFFTGFTDELRRHQVPFQDGSEDIEKLHVLAPGSEMDCEHI